MSEKNLAKRTAQGYVSGAFIVSVSDSESPVEPKTALPIWTIRHLLFRRRLLSTSGQNGSPCF